MSQTITTPVRSPCDTCAFRAGCETQDEPQNVLKADICVATPLPFHCHYSAAGDWHELEFGEMTRADTLALRKELPICEGWRREVKAKAAAGYYGDTERRKIRRWLGVHALQLLRKFIDQSGDIKDEACRELENVLRMLMKPPKKKKGHQRK